jgi:endogenous inhibitor of DNA gyrase (YacG/DUF329 family)
MPIEPKKEERKVRCPQCHAVILWRTDNPWRPFCSERCKLIDFGQWATGAYRIPQSERDNGQAEDEEL